MRFSRLFGFVLVAGAAAGAASAGCYSVGGDCNLFDCGSGGTSGTGGTSTGGTMSTGGTTGTGTTTTPSGCVPADAAGPVADGCGVFVSPAGADANPGTKDKPLKSIGAAIEKAKDLGQRVYACAQTFTESAKVDASVTIFGGLDCDKGWAYVGATKHTTWTADPDKVPVHVAASVGLIMEDVDVTAADAATPGGSSIAIVAEAMGSLDLTRVNVKAGAGAPGKSGDPFQGTAPDGMVGSAGADACTAALVTSPLAPANKCSDVDSVGGGGGNGTPNAGQPGSPGLPQGNDNGGTGDGGSGCKLGTVGVNGTDGMAGSGATGSGKLTPDGYAGVAGSDGTPGTSAQGGGGGGGAKGGSGATKCSDAAKAGGASGGTGGSGGCGGAAGHGGGPGGSSIGIVSLGTKLAFKTVTITAKQGGSGGAGSDGQGGGSGAPGGEGGMLPAGASGLLKGCKGGKGGDGGKGGFGGGGLGGHSFGIAYSGEVPDAKGATIVLGAAGDGGAGDGVNDMTKGAKGLAKDIQSF